VNRKKLVTSNKWKDKKIMIGKNYKETRKFKRRWILKNLVQKMVKIFS